MQVLQQLRTFNYNEVAWDWPCSSGQIGLSSFGFVWLEHQLTLYRSWKAQSGFAYSVSIASLSIHVDLDEGVLYMDAARTYRLFRKGKQRLFCKPML